MTFGVSIPPTSPSMSGPDLQFTIQSPPPAAPRYRRSARPHPHNGNIAPPSVPLVGYSLAHAVGGAQKVFGEKTNAFTHFAAAPVTGLRPEKGVRRLTVTCLTCHQPVPVLVRSPAAVVLERWKRAAYVVFAALVFYAFTVFIPWNRLLGTYDTCIGLIIFFAFGAVALYNGARVIAPEENLLVDLVRKPFLDIIPSLSRRLSHTILHRKL